MDSFERDSIENERFGRDVLYEDFKGDVVPSNRVKRGVRVLGGVNAGLDGQRGIYLVFHQDLRRKKVYGWTHIEPVKPLKGPPPFYCLPSNRTDQDMQP